jgi:integrase
MRVEPINDIEGGSYQLLDDDNQPIEIVSAFLRHLHARGYSPNTLSAYAYDLPHFWNFLKQHQIGYLGLMPSQGMMLLSYLRTLPSRRKAHRLSLVLCTNQAGPPGTYLSAKSVNRILAAVSSFYEYLILSGQLTHSENPIQRESDLAYARVSERHQPFTGGASRQRPIRRTLHVKTARSIPRPLTDEQVEKLLSSLDTWRDRAMILLMLQGGLRPGEVLNLHLEDIQYGRRRVIVRYRTDHPSCVRTKSRVERVVDLYEPESLQAVSNYVMQERPEDAQTSFVFLVGGHSARRHQPLGYHGLLKMFQRHCARLNMRDPWITPHALRHTHATRMWEGGMRELTLQKRLGHVSPEATRIYTRVSDPMVVAEYRQALGDEVIKSTTAS